MGLISCTVTFLCKCIRSYQHSDIALFSIPVNGLWFTGVETGGAMVLYFLKFLVRRLMCQLALGLVGKQLQVRDSFSDGIVGVSAADRVSWKVG